MKTNCWPSFFECLAQLRLVDVAHLARTVQGSEVHTPMIGGEIGAAEPGFELVALLTPDDWMRLAELVGEYG